MMEQAYFTIRWKRLLISFVILMGVYATWMGVLGYQRDKLSDRLLVTARQLADGSDSAAAKVAYLDYLELHSDDAVARVELIQHVQKTESAGDERDMFVVSQSTAAIRCGDSTDELRITLVDAAMRLEWFSTVSQWLPTVTDVADQYPRLTAYNGLCLLKKGELDDAEGEFKTALLADSSCLVAWSGLVQLKERRGNAKAAAKVADEWVAKTSSPQAFLTQARLLAKQGKPNEAAGLYQSAVLPSQSDIELVRELVVFFVHDLPLATEVDEDVLRRVYDVASLTLKEPSYDDLACLADLAHRSGQMELAQTHYQQCLDIRPGDLFAIGRQVELFSSTGQSDQAIQALARLSDSSSQRVLKTTLRARLLAQESRFKEAVIELESVLKLHSEIGVKQDCYALLVECLWEREQFLDAAVRARELLELIPSSDNARRFCAEAFIRSNQYAEAITCIRGFAMSAKEQVNAVWRLMAHAQETGQESQLIAAIEDAALMNREATVPVLFAAFRACDAGKTTDGIQLLLRTLVEYPRREVFRIGIQAVQDRASERISKLGLANASELRDSTDRRIFLRQMMTEEPEQVAAQVSQLLNQIPNELSVLNLLHQLLEDCRDQPKMQRRLLLDVYPDLTKIVAAQGDDAIPVVAQILAASDLEEQAFELLVNSMGSQNSLPLMNAFCELTRSASEGSPFDQSSIVQNLDSGRLSLPEGFEDVLRAEFDFQDNQPRFATVRILPLVSSGAVSDAATLILMMHADQLDSVKLPTLNPDVRLQEKYPDHAAVMLASSRWNRKKGMYLISAKRAEDSFLVHQSPETLLEMAYSEWLDNSVDRASGLMALSFDLQLNVKQLQPLHKRMIQEMRADSRMDLNVLTSQAKQVQVDSVAL
ncbi:MAG: tetratricopeptide repeat protein [Fuerstiella sp.]